MTKAGVLTLAVGVIFVAETSSTSYSGTHENIAFIRTGPCIRELKRHLEAPHIPCQVQIVAGRSMMDCYVKRCDQRSTMREPRSQGILIVGEPVDTDRRRKDVNIFASALRRASCEHIGCVDDGRRVS